MKLIDKFTSAEKDALEHLEAMVKLRNYFREQPTVEVSLKKITGFGLKETAERIDSLRKYLQDSLSRFEKQPIYHCSTDGIICSPIEVTVWGCSDEIELRYNSDDGKYECSGEIRKIKLCKP